MFEVELNGQIYQVRRGLSIFEASKFIGVNIPKWCYPQDLPKFYIGIYTVNVNQNPRIFSWITSIRQDVVISRDSNEVKRVAP
jgi:NADH dehydrogenase/NADH:ubiquinone oxidoreductase subunit G